MQGIDEWMVRLPGPREPVEGTSPARCSGFSGEVSFGLSSWEASLAPLDLCALCMMQDNY
jgi:hypothetical protein